jgi:hypothetical protein
MRRPAQQPNSPTARTPWAHPYRGIRGLEVFYNDGGQGAAPAPIPTPADLAARTAPPAPAQAATPPTGSEPLIDKDTGLAMTQDRFTKIMKRQYDKSRHAAYRELAEAAGLPFDPDTFDPSTFSQLLKSAQEARQQAMTDEQRRTEELERQQQSLASEQSRLEQERTQIAEARRALAREQALTRLGALDVTDEQGQVTAPNLQDALAMLERDLRQTPDADPAAVVAAADALKKRRPELFGATMAAQVLPPAPSGGPAGGNAPRTSVPGKDAVKEAARKRAEAMGLRQAS